MAVRVRFPQPGRSIEVEPGTRLLDAVRRAGLPIASACGADGICARCGVRIDSGEAPLPAESERERIVKQRNRIDPEARLACRIHLDADVSVTTSYW